LAIHNCVRQRKQLSLARRVGFSVSAAVYKNEDDKSGEQTTVKKNSAHLIPIFILIVILSSAIAGSSPHPERNPGDEVAAEAVLEAVEDFLAAVADDFGQPHAAIHFVLQVTRLENLMSEDITICDTLMISFRVSSSLKSAGNLSRLRRTAWFSTRVSTP